MRSDETIVWVCDDAGIAYDDGAPLYIQGYMADITERKATEAKLQAEHAYVLELEREQNERLRELDVMKDEFVALVSHELRTPLTTITGYTELVLDGTAGELNDEQRLMLSAIDRSSARLFRLINDLLFVAQVNAGTMDVAFENVDLAAVARVSLEDARERAAAAEVALEFDFELTPAVKADPMRLAQVFDNLISNAIKFTPPGGNVRLTISMVGDEAIVDAHHGSISVESEVGEGTSFTFSVPALGLATSRGGLELAG